MWTRNKLKVARATFNYFRRNMRSSIVQGRVVGVTRYFLGGIAATWIFFLVRIIGVG